MHTLRIQSETLSYPEKWDELTRKQLFTVIRFFTKGSTEIEFRVKTILNFLKIRLSRREPALRDGELLHHIVINKKTYWVSNTALTETANTLSFLTEEGTAKNGNPVIALNSSLTKNLIPHFHHRFRTYFGPDEKLFNITFDEFLEAESHYSAFSKTGNTKELSKLTAVLYRREAADYNPKSVDYSGDRRRPFNSELVNYHARLLKHFDYETKLAISLFFQGCLNFLNVNFPHVFSKKGGKSGRDYGPLSLIDALSGDDVTKNEQILKSRLYSVMVRLERAALQYEQMNENKKI